MPVNTYEFLILIDSGKIAGDPDAAKALIRSYIEKVGGEIVVGRDWDERRLAYTIEHQKKGLYYLIYANIESTKLKEIELELRLNEVVLRYMVIKIHAKWVETMLAIGRNEREFAYHGMTDDTDGTGGDPVGAIVGEDGEAPPRRGPRRGPAPEAEPKE